MSTLRVAFKSNSDPKVVACQIVRFLEYLEAREVKASLIQNQPTTIVVDVAVNDQTTAAHAADALLTVKTDWEIVGPLCPIHGVSVLQAVAMSQRTWKCTIYGCCFETSADYFLTMQDLLAKRRAPAETSNGRIPTNTDRVTPPHPMLHVLPDAVMETALSLRAADPNSIKIRTDVHDEVVYEVKEGSPEHLAMEKALILGEVPKSATVLDLMAKAAKAQERIGYVDTLQGRARDLGRTPPVSLEQAKELVDTFRTSYPDIEKYWNQRENAKLRNLAVLYGGKDPMLEALEKLIEDLKHGIKRRDAQISDLTDKNKDLAAWMRVVGNNLNLKERKLGEALAQNQSWEKEVDSLMGAVQATDRLIRTVAGLNLQDHPLSVQREVRAALEAAMRAMKGEDLT